jgi:hypothetical protein
MSLRSKPLAAHGSAMTVFGLLMLAARRSIF